MYTMSYCIIKCTRCNTVQLNAHAGAKLLEEIIRRADADRDGRLSYQAHTHTLSLALYISLSHTLSLALYLSLSLSQTLTHSLSLRRADADRDGRLSYQAFSRATPVTRERDLY